jgi:hypothetical protein
MALLVVLVVAVVLLLQVCLLAVLEQAVKETLVVEI